MSCAEKRGLKKETKEAKKDMKNTQKRAKRRSLEREVDGQKRDGGECGGGETDINQFVTTLGA